MHDQHRYETIKICNVHYLFELQVIHTFMYHLGHNIKNIILRLIFIWKSYKCTLNL